MRDFVNYNDEHGVCAASQTASWDYERKRPYRGDVMKEDRRIYKHFFFNPERAEEDAKLFHRYTLQELIDELDVIECLEVPGRDPIFGEVL